MAKLKGAAKKFWNFVWNDNSVWSWIFNAALAFLLIKFLVYPGLGLVLHTQSPVVAVISDSMNHYAGFEEWWASMEKNYATFAISKEDFTSFKMSNGFRKGDLIILKGKSPKDIEVGDVLVFRGGKPEPIIHRVVDKRERDGNYHFSTKGDANAGQRDEEKEISKDRIIGTGWVKVPYLGYVKIIFTDIVKAVRG
ncbi:signal peptidase I [Candidatus Woesearchaeota archaeon]|nr:signal peptidase I [Candidatus Woesearchaeota archaeon]